MHALFFEMRPKPGHLDHYFDHVARLRPILARHTGLAFLDRYGSLSDPDLLLSHQLWDSEASIMAWRNDPEHRRSQAAGIEVHFVDYRIRVGKRILHRHAHDAGVHNHEELGVEPAGVLAAYGSKPELDPMFSAFKSLNRADRFVSLASFQDVAEIDTKVMLAMPGVDEIAAYSIRRDYGRFDREQAP